MRSVVIAPWTGKEIVCRTPAAARELAERARLADQPWRTEGRAEAQRAR